VCAEGVIKLHLMQKTLLLFFTPWSIPCSEPITLLFMESWMVSLSPLIHHPSVQGRRKHRDRENSAHEEQSEKIVWLVNFIYVFSIHAYP
jgi:hypothetical protein